MHKEPVSLIPRFDPREMPLAAAGETLPPVRPERLDPQALRERFANPPAWTPEQTSDRFRLDRADPREAAVLVPLVMHRTGTTVLLTQRTLHLRHHSGQVAFPGGRIEDDDRSPVDAALREAHEEIGLEPSRVEVIGHLPEYLTGTGFRVTPVVGLLEAGFVPTPDPSEVADVFEVPLAFLMDPRHHQRRTVRVDQLPGAQTPIERSIASSANTSVQPTDRAAERTFFAMPYRAPGEDEEHFIWGATAAMLRNLYRLLVA